jgi:hypothetical protein
VVVEGEEVAGGILSWREVAGLICLGELSGGAQYRGEVATALAAAVPMAAARATTPTVPKAISPPNEQVLA